MRCLVFLLLTLVPLRAESITLQILATTDMHGNLVAWDYFTGRPAARGLAKVATLIRQMRAENPNTLLIDNGDTIQGSSLEAVHQTAVREGLTTRIDPMMAAMNRLGYHAMVPGNHEFNFGLKNLNRARDEAKFEWISANIANMGAARAFRPYRIETVAGVRTGIFGITTPNIPNWEKPENYAGYAFEPAVEAARRAVEQLKREGCDVIIGSVHAGLTPPSGGQSENMADAIAREVPGIDALIFGHTHMDTEELRIGSTVLTQPGRWAERLSVIRINLERVNGKWTVQSRSARLLKVTAETPEDPEILAIAKPYHDEAERWLSTPVASSPATLESRLGRAEDTALMDAVHAVQMHYAKADVSFTALFNPRVRINPGPVTARQIAALYPYENELYAIEGNGQMVKLALENAARYYLPCPEPTCSQGPLSNRNMAGYNFDVAQGVTYDLDLSKPVGERIVNLRFQGQPLAPDRKLRIAVNSYRAAGSNGYTMFRNAPVLWQSYRSITDLMIEYFRERKELPAKPDGNWRIVPPAAQKVVASEAGGY